MESKVKYLNVILTIIAILMLLIYLKPHAPFATQANAQQTAPINYSYVKDEGLANATQAVAMANKDIAKAVEKLASSVDGVARAIETMANAKPGAYGGVEIQAEPETDGAPLGKIEVQPAEPKKSE